MSMELPGGRGTHGGHFKAPKVEPGVLFAPSEVVRVAAVPLLVPKPEPGVVCRPPLEVVRAAPPLKVPKPEPGVLIAELEVLNASPQAKSEVLDGPSPVEIEGQLNDEKDGQFRLANGSSSTILKVPKAEPRRCRNLSRKSVVLEPPIELSSSEDDEPSSQVEESSDGEESDESSDHSGWSDSEEDYVVDSDDEDEESRRPRSKKRHSTNLKVKSDLEPKVRIPQKTRCKTTAKRPRTECFLKTRDSDPGRRKVGNRIYDSVLGETCHWCRQKTVELHVQCSLCPIRFCGQCLLNRNGEIIVEEMEKNVRWVCPKCRGGCGPGCDNCCNCGPCRIAQRFKPTGQLIHEVRRHGFSNAHDYIIHGRTNETPEAIAKRKEGRGWTKATGAIRNEKPHMKKTKVHMKWELKDENKHIDNIHEGKEGHRCTRGTGDLGNAKSEDEHMEDVAKEKKGHRCTRGTGDLGNTKAEKKNDVRKFHVKLEPNIEKEGNEEEDEEMEDVQISEGRSGEERIEEQEAVTPEPAPNISIKDKISEQDTQSIKPAELLVYRLRSKDKKISTTTTNTVSSGRRDTVSKSKNSVASKTSKLMPVGKTEYSVDEGKNFKEKLDLILQRPFSVAQLREMVHHARARKPVLIMRQTRGRCIQVPSSQGEGPSYLDHYPDLAKRLEEESSPEEKLKLLRGFFFWLEYVSMEGSFRPWVTVKDDIDDSGECVATNGPDCKIIKVLLAIDENEDNLTPPTEWEDRKPIVKIGVKPLNAKVNSTKPLNVRVKQEKGI